ncbi:LPXTG cell wall anchor domain-containing protein [Enterococcus crotali]|uniref:LPXTG cell wall anchor domain-containing protein n=1 Tax=Enterococcus crotali TaxID=1453587 RepID=UPI00046FED5F|nr:LPXTG cell wall anchor domain-containing protein [Enterococcus crotali]OTP50616.1 hypothetical protein A5881_002040 [Enterococcus termitis]
MKHKIKYLLLSTFILVIVGACSSQTVFAEAGAAQTNGKVSFYDDTPIDSSSTTDPSGTTEPTNSNGDSGGSSVKPVGKLPSTGELIAKSLTISGSILLVLGLSFVLVKKKRRAE